MIYGNIEFEITEEELNESVTESLRDALGNAGKKFKEWIKKMIAYIKKLIGNVKVKVKWAYNVMTTKSDYVDRSIGRVDKNVTKEMANILKKMLSSKQYQTGSNLHDELVKAWSVYDSKLTDAGCSLTPEAYDTKLLDVCNRLVDKINSTPGGYKRFGKLILNQSYVKSGNVRSIVDAVNCDGDTINMLYQLGLQSIERRITDETGFSKLSSSFLIGTKLEKSVFDDFAGGKWSVDMFRTFGGQSDTVDEKYDNIKSLLEMLDKDALSNEIREFVTKIINVSLPALNRYVYTLTTTMPQMEIAIKGRSLPIEEAIIQYCCSVSAKSDVKPFNYM